ncbi:hypothetical protein OPV22_025423 [Ensete ventricosum]|uniref:SAM domain-containing protein n=1 Tax=Ensete ventricosum TaxID=4639 RepID=A0AAV8QHH4_ENSVE|nr:hypothetical protein OPV22_025423 [Ensete ventricosum]
MERRPVNLKWKRHTCHDLADWLRHECDGGIYSLLEMCALDFKILNGDPLPRAHVRTWWSCQMYRIEMIHIASGGSCLDFDQQKHANT